MANHTTKSITIYQKTYQLPVLESDSFQQIQTQIKQRQQIIKQQKRTKKFLFGLYQNIQELTFEEKFEELDYLITDYDKLIAFLTEHKEVYLQFLAQVTNYLRDVVKEKLQEAIEQENERLQLLHQENNLSVINILQNQKDQILANVWLFGKAFLLLLKKIELMSEGIEKITSDQDTQKKLLIEMVGKLSKYKKIYDLQRRITKSGEDAQKMADTAINFEKYLQPFIGSFQGLIDQVCEQDNNLSGTVNEIQSLVEDIMSSKTGNFMSTKADEFSKNMLDFLITNEQKKERLIIAVEEAQSQGIDWSWQQIDIKDCDNLTKAITALQSHIDGKLGAYSQEVSIETRLQVPRLLQPAKTTGKTSATLKEDLGNGVILELVKISAGEFMMGTENAEIERLNKQYNTDWFNNQKPIHKVKLKEFYMGKYPVTKAQYQAIMGNNPSNFKGENNPVEQVSYDMAQKFCQKLSQKTGKTYKLPSEAQWEYACRAGSTGKWSFGNDENQLKDYAWYGDNSNRQTHPVGQKKPNKWGLYDMHGNVWEWCEDDYVDNYNNTAKDGTSYINQNMKYKCLRGGSWYSISDNCRCANRNGNTHDNIYNNNGFRVMLPFSRTT